MKKFIFFVCLFLIVFSAKSQDDATNTNLLEFYGKIKQAQFVDANITKTGIDLVVSRGVNENQDIVAIRNFVNEKLGLKFIITPEQRNEAYSASSSYCDVVSVNWTMGSFGSAIGAVGSYPFDISFSLCDGKTYSFSSKINVNGYTYNIGNAIKRTLDRMFPNAENQYSGTKSVIKSGEVIMNETELKAHFDSKTSTNKSEGIYKLYSSTDFVSADKVALVEKNNKLYILNLENKYFKDDYKYGEVRGEAIKTSNDKIYIGKYKNIIKLEDDMSLTILNEGMFEISFTKGASKMVFIKL
jgi:hypothetical protein